MVKEIVGLHPEIPRISDPKGKKCPEELGRRDFLKRLGASSMGLMFLPSLLRRASTGLAGSFIEGFVDGGDETEPSAELQRRELPYETYSPDQLGPLSQLEINAIQNRNMADFYVGQVDRYFKGETTSYIEGTYQEALRAYEIGSQQLEKARQYEEVMSNLPWWHIIERRNVGLESDRLKEAGEKNLASAINGFQGATDESMDLALADALNSLIKVHKVYAWNAVSPSKEVVITQGLGLSRQDLQNVLLHKQLSEGGYSPHPAERWVYGGTIHPDGANIRSTPKFKEDNVLGDNRYGYGNVVGNDIIPPGFRIKMAKELPHGWYEIDPVTSLGSELTKKLGLDPNKKFYIYRTQIVSKDY